MIQLKRAAIKYPQLCISYYGLRPIVVDLIIQCKIYFYYEFKWRYCCLVAMLNNLFLQNLSLSSVLIYIVEEFLSRLRCSPVKININRWYLETILYGGQWDFEKIPLKYTKRRLIVTKVGTSVDRDAAQLLANLDFWYLSLKKFYTPSNFSLPLRSMGPKISICLNT